MNIIPLLAIVFYPMFSDFWDSPKEEIPAAWYFPSSPPFISADAFASQQKLYTACLDPHLRQRMIFSWNEANNAEIIPALEALLQHEKKTNLQAQIIDLIHLISVKEKVKIDAAFFVPYLDNPDPNVRAAAGRILRQETTALPHILSRLAKEDAELAATSMMPDIATIPAAPGIPDEAQILRNIKQTKLIPVHAFFLQLLAATSKNPDTVTLLQDVLKSNNLLDIIAVARGISKRPAPILAGKLAASKNNAVRLAVAGLFPIANDESSLKILCNYAQNDPVPFIRERACQSLANFPNPQIPDAILTALSGALRDSSPEVRAAACASLKKLYPEVLPEKLLKMAGDAAVLPYIAQVIENTGNPEHFAVLNKILADTKSDSIMIICLNALRNMKLKPVPPALSMSAYAKSKNPKVRIALVGLLDVIDGQESVTLLKDLIADRDESVAYAALLAAGRRNDMAFEDEFSLAICDYQKKPEFRGAACRALAHLPKISNDHLSALSTTAATACIPVPLAPPIYDNPGVRALAIAVIQIMAKRGSSAAKNKFEAVMERFNNPTQKDMETGFFDELIMLYLKQIQDYIDGEKTVPAPIPAGLPELPYRSTEINP